MYPDDDDVYDYWQDLEYLSDGGYHDNGDPDAPRKKRKLDIKDSSAQASTKRRRLSTKTPAKSFVQPVLWMNLKERNAAAAPTPLNKLRKLKSVGLMRDWETKTRDQQGLATFPEGDFQLEDKKQEGEERDEENDYEDVEGEGFDLGDLKSVAGLLSGENMEALQKMMEAKGMDPAVVQEVLKDMLEGREREFSDDDGEGEEEAGGHEAQEQADETEYKEHGKVTTNPAPRKSGSSSGNAGHPQDGTTGTRSTLNFSPAANGTSAHGTKRKAQGEGHGEIAEDLPPTKFTRRKPKADQSASLDSESPARQTRSMRRRR